ncbi:hypothetical protein BDP27DRAFT_1422590 [Rhodocollybia butyracea]|uniref:Uncharacterized protein n=1 Tax=Rhodocollybia butyracea TaxID=206335 RepID=A0A9P5PPQ2_9AGAR|nr:hypothetical protein BDP27DRAFT_1422590 [Rhodocollybia butyracea]
MNGGQSVHDNAGLGRGLDNLEMDHNTYTHRIDDYTRNSLNSFSFGNAKLATAAGEDDEEGENISPTTTTIDVTPRPSVVSQTDFAPYAGSSRLSTSSRLSPTPSPSSFVSEADTRASHLHEVEFSSDDDSYEFDHLEYPEDDETSKSVQHGSPSALVILAMDMVPQEDTETAKAA